MKNLLITALLICIGYGMATLSASPFAYGYGYGTTTCTGETPSDVIIQQTHQQRQVRVSWSAVTFTDCAQAEADHYKVDLRTNSGHVIKTYETVVGTTKTIPNQRLKWNYSYKVRIQAVAIDGTTSTWSGYHLFRSSPKFPERLSVTWQAEQLVYLSWNNVARSNALRYYQITVWHNNKRVIRKKVHTGLSAARTGAYLRMLQRSERYRVTVRSVYSGTVYSKDAELIVE